VRIRREQDEAGGDRLGSFVDMHGAFSVSDVPFGELRVELLPQTPATPVVYGRITDELPLATKTVDLDAGELEVELRAGVGTLAITGVGPSAKITVRNDCGRSSAVHPEYARRGVMMPAGSLRVDVSIGERAITRRVDVAMGSTTTLDLSAH
jgi:hypothetical protein